MIPSEHGASPDSRLADQTKLIDLLLASLEALAATDKVEDACRLAGQACAALRQSDQAGWRRFNSLLHRLSGRLSW